jgi:putative addiction module component (TIGR02574 family)
MSKALLKIEREAARLPVKDREVLAERLMRSVRHEPLTQVEEAWVEEAERRFSAWRCGTRTGSRLRERSNRFARIWAAV